MKILSCERACELLPLHIAGDLEGSREREVAAHVAGCDECRTLATEFDESRSLLAEACAPPEFGSDFYANIRSAVLAEIARDQRRPSTPSFFNALFRRRLAHAATFALLLLACLMALQHLRRNTRETLQQIVTTQDTNGSSREKEIAVDAPSPSPEHSTTLTNSHSSDNRRGDSESRALFVKAERSARELHPEWKTRRDAMASAGTLQRVLDEIALVPRASLNSVRAMMASGASAVASSNAASQSAPEVSRIEIQTADPNIRIIWLSPRKAEEPGTDPDNHENGDRN
jgi:hypothetical protein